jgi:hypothetical protein
MAAAKVLKVGLLASRVAGLFFFSPESRLPHL